MSTRSWPVGKYLWDGTDASMANYAIFNWAPSRAPVAMAFLQDAVFDGDFPASKAGHAFVSESGPTYANGPQVNGKRISEFVLDAGGALPRTGPTPLIEYTGTGRATASGLAFGCQTGCISRLCTGTSVPPAQPTAELKSCASGTSRPSRTTLCDDSSLRGNSPNGPDPDRDVARRAGDPDSWRWSLALACPTTATRAPPPTSGSC